MAHPNTGVEALNEPFPTQDVGIGGLLSESTMTIGTSTATQGDSQSTSY